MKNFSTYAVAPFTFIANKAQRVEIVGQTIFFRSGSAEITVRLNSPSNPAIPLREGERLECSGFNALILESVSGQDAVLIISPDNVKIEGINVVGQMSVNPGSTLQTTQDVSVAVETTSVVIAANPSRKEVNIGNLATNGSIIRVGDSDTASNQGQPLQPGQDVWIETEDAIYVYNSDDTNAAAITLLENLK